MCGIAGILTFNGLPVNVEELRRMTDEITHRGPDGEGHWVNPSGNVGLGHRRLAIIDLSENGRQPMQYANGRYWITFNGEIYNYLELKESLISKGYSFQSNSDTEVLLAIYDLKKENCLEDLDGMFAFAIWDESEGNLFCARDRFGEKPFYYHYIPGQKFLFASEMKAIFTCGVGKEMNEDFRMNYINNSIIVSDPKDKSRTFYQNVKKLEQSHYLKIDKKGKIVKSRYWDINISKLNNNIDFETAMGRFKNLFYDSITKRLRSDVPLGSSLSGGLDSSAIVCAIHELNPEKKWPQCSFSARFRNFERDEGKFIEKVIQKTGITAYQVWQEEGGFQRDFEKLCYHQEEPFPSASVYAQYAVMQLAKANGVTVLLDGQGADELLAGYEKYFETYLNELHDRNPSSYQSQLSALVEMHNGLDFVNLDILPSKKTSLSPKEKVKNILRPIYQFLKRSKSRNHNKSYRQYTAEAIFTNSFLDQFVTSDYFELKSDYSSLNSHLKDSFFVNNLEDLLRFSDRNAMAFSREVRLPFLSKDLVEFTFSLPAEFKINAGWSKYLLRQSLKEILPSEIAWRKDKIGFEPPQKLWMSNQQTIERIEDARNDLIKRKVLKDCELNDSQRFALMSLSYFDEIFDK